LEVDVRRIHLTLWDCRSALPLGNGPRLCSRDGKSRATYGYPMAYDFVNLENNEAAYRAMAIHRERWLSTRRACNGRWLDSRNAREMFDSTEDPSCPFCVRLWETVQVLRDMKQERAA
jgi:hypothetical protein